MYSFTKSLPASVLISLLITASTTATEPGITVDTVINRYIAALGGRDAIEELTVRQCTGRVTTDLTSRTEPVYDSHGFKVCCKATHEYLFEDIFDGPGQVVGFDGLVGWKQTQCGIEPKEDVGSSKLAWLCNPQNAAQIRDYFPELTLAGTEWVGGCETYVLEPADRDPLYFAMHFDVETGLLVSLGAYWQLSDYRRVDGVLFPHRIATSRKGGATTYVFETVTHNVEVNDAVFKMP